jgi:hypothetical protein
LDESKYEWAVIEKILAEQQELSDIANNNVAASERLTAMEAGKLETEMVVQPTPGPQHMQRV